MKLSPDEITRLSLDERLALIAQLWGSLDEAQVLLTSEQQKELERRLSCLDQDRALSVSWDMLKGKLEDRCP